MIFKRNLLILLLGTAGLILTGNQCTHSTEPKHTGPDTTSHHFIWTIDTIGYRDTELHDAVIIDENNIWVVGEIYPDSASHKDAIIHGAIHWNGTKWEYKKIPWKHLWGYDTYLWGTAIVNIDENRFFIGVAHEYDKQKVIKSHYLHVFTGNPNPIFEQGQAATKLFKTSDGKIYCYGRKGALAYFTGTNWIKIPTPTDLDIVDMHGDWNPRTGEYELIALASTDYSNLNGSKLLKITGQSVTELSVEGINNYSKHSIWFNSDNGYYVGGDGVYYKKKLDDLTWERVVNYPAENWMLSSVKGFNKNDLFFVLNNGHLLHYNGNSWKDLKQEFNTKNNIRIYEIILKGNLVTVLGYLNDGSRRGVILRGKRP